MLLCTLPRPAIFRQRYCGNELSMHYRGIARNVDALTLRGEKLVVRYWISSMLFLVHIDVGFCLSAGKSRASFIKLSTRSRCWNVTCRPCPSLILVPPSRQASSCRSARLRRTRKLLPRSLCGSPIAAPLALVSISLSPERPSRC